MYFVKRCRSERRALTLRLSKKRVFYIYNAMGVRGQEAEICTLLAYCETDDAPSLFAALMAAIRTRRPDVRLEPGMVRAPEDSASNACV